MEEEMAVLYKGEDIEIRKIVTGSYSNNAYLAVCPKTNESVIIDAPDEADKILDQAQDTNVQAVLFTHTHFDHIPSFDALKSALKVPMVVHPDDEDQLPGKADRHFSDNGAFSFGSITFRTIHVPGHTPGGTSLLWGDHLFSGDTLFPGGPGYTESGPNFQQLVGALEEKIFVLADNLNVYPGHGDETVLNKEKALFGEFKKRDLPDDFHGEVAWVAK
jgi:glyoxylase-like metal-dependent hydrolase (beta-lactamase superfamily II)